MASSSSSDSSSSLPISSPTRTFVDYKDNVLAVRELERMLMSVNRPPIVSGERRCVSEHGTASTGTDTPAAAAAHAISGPTRRDGLRNLGYTPSIPSRISELADLQDEEQEEDNEEDDNPFVVLYTRKGPGTKQKDSTATATANATATNDKKKKSKEKEEDDKLKKKYSNLVTGVLKEAQRRLSLEDDIQLQQQQQQQVVEKATTTTTTTTGAKNTNSSTANSAWLEELESPQELTVSEHVKTMKGRVRKQGLALEQLEKQLTEFLTDDLSITSIHLTATNSSHLLSSAATTKNNNRRRMPQDHKNNKKNNDSLSSLLRAPPSTSTTMQLQNKMNKKQQQQRGGSSGSSRRASTTTSTISKRQLSPKRNSAKI